MKTSKQRAVRTAKQGFTLIELLVVIGIIAILATVVLVAINPARQFKQANDTQRVSNVNAILNAIGQNIADNKGTFKCDIAGVLTPVSINPTSTPITSTYVGNCLVPTYLSSLPFDPKTGSVTDTGYSVIASSTDRITVSAQSEINPSIPISVTR